METFVQLGEQPGLEIDTSPGHYVKLYATKTSKSILGGTAELLKDLDKINISLSGGIDSQFSLLVAKELKKDITAYTYRTFWDNTICNAEDVYMAEYMSDKNNIKLNVIDINLKTFFDTNQHFKYGKEYGNTSPQLSVHLYWLDLLQSEYKIKNILMGGDPPLFKYTLLDKKENKFRNNDSFYQDILAPYYLFCKSKNILCLRDMYYHSPELVYAGFKNNIEVVNKHKIYIDNDIRRVKSSNSISKAGSPFLTDDYIFKYQWYNNIIEGLVPQKAGTTGFESLKRILASESGEYNKFDTLYRYPMWDQGIDTVRMRIKTNKRKRVLGRNIIMPKTIHDLYFQYAKMVKDTGAKPVNRFNFDF